MRRLMSPTVVIARGFVGMENIFDSRPAKKEKHARVTSLSLLGGESRANFFRPPSFLSGFQRTVTGVTRCTRAVLKI